MPIVNYREYESLRLCVEIGSGEVEGEGEAAGVLRIA